MLFFSHRANNVNGEISQPAGGVRLPPLQWSTVRQPFKNLRTGCPKVECPLSQRVNNVNGEISQPAGGVRLPFLAQLLTPGNEHAAY